MRNRISRKCLFGLIISVSLFGLLVILAGCGGGGGGGGSSTPEEQPPAPPFGLNIYDGERGDELVSSGTLSRSTEGDYVLNLEGKQSSFDRGAIRISSRRVSLPIGPQGEEETFSLSEFQRGLKALDGGKEVRLKANSGRTFELQPKAVDADSVE